MIFINDNCCIKNEVVEESARYYEKSLQEEITSDREAHGKKPLKEKDKAEPTIKNMKKSTTDPDCGLFHKGEHKKVFAYTSNTAGDKNNYILGFEVTPGMFMILFLFGNYIIK